MQERKEKVKEQLAVRISPDVPPKKLRDRLRQPLTDPGEPRDGARVREEPLPVAEGMGVLRPHRSHRGAANVPDEHVRTDVLQRVGDGEHGPVVHRPATEKDLASLVKTHTPAERIARGALLQQSALGLDHLCSEVGTIRDEAEETSHADLQHRPSRRCHLGFKTYQRKVKIFGSRECTRHTTTPRSGINAFRRRGEPHLLLLPDRVARVQVSGGSAPPSSLLLAARERAGQGVRARRRAPRKPTGKCRPSRSSMPTEGHHPPQANGRRRSATL
jgi:hypothetical protein